MDKACQGVARCQPEAVRRRMTDEELKMLVDQANAIGFRDMREKMQPLVDKAKALVELLDDAEVNHGGLVGGVTLRAKNDLRLELSKWR